MRLYVYEQGRPGFISAEVAIPDELYAEAVARGMKWNLVNYMPERFPGGGQAFTREQLLEVSTRRRALLAWEAGDDSALAEEWRRARVENDRREVEDFARRGCPEAQAVVARGLDPAECERWQAGHDCSGHRRHLTVV